MTFQNVQGERPPLIDARGSTEYFDVIRRSRSGEFRVLGVQAVRNSEWRFLVTYHDISNETKTNTAAD